MEARIDEIGAGISRLFVFVPDAVPPAGLTFNHFLFAGDDPLLFHCGKRKMFPLVSAAVARVMPVDRLRWLGLGHFEADLVRIDERMAGPRGGAPRRLTHACEPACYEVTVPRNATGNDGPPNQKP